MHCEVCIIGAGVVGLALARELGRRSALATRGICLLEQEDSFGQHSSSRNSEVIHAGLYYPQGSLKARLCLQGRELLYDYCQRRRISHQQTGKLIVAQEGEEAALHVLQQNALDSGVAEPDLVWLDKTRLGTLEPAVRGAAALFSRRSGIVDSHGLMQQLLADACAAGVDYAPCTRVNGIEAMDAGGFVVRLQSGSQREAVRLRCRTVINCAGLQALELAQGIEGLTSEALPELAWVKGHYFSYRGTSPLRHLLYPLPERSGLGLGIHATLDLAGQLRFGPDTEPVQQLDYGVDASRREQFAAAIRRYLPSLDAARLQPDYAGIRARLAAPGMADFIVSDGDASGMPGLIQLFGIESPGLTASLALAVMVADRVSTQYC